MGDSDDLGKPVFHNGPSLCSIHHRAFDKDLMGIAPDLRVHVSRRFLEEADCPMLDLLKAFHRKVIHVPERKVFQPDPDRLALRFERFSAAG